MSEAPRRRDLLTTLAFATAGAGFVAALWPLIDSMNPAADTRAKATVFKLSGLESETPRIIAVGKYPVMLFRRNAQELANLRAAIGTQTMKFRDVNSAHSKQPEAARNWHRSFKPELMVCIANCTREGCVVTRQRRTLDTADEIRCLCCGAAYDLAGRVFSGPARTNLTVPNHRFIGNEAIEFNDINLLG